MMIAFITIIGTQGIFMRAGSVINNVDQALVSKSFQGAVYSDAIGGFQAFFNIGQTNCCLFLGKRIQHQYAHCCRVDVFIGQLLFGKGVHGRKVKSFSVVAAILFTFHIKLLKVS